MIYSELRRVQQNTDERRIIISEVNMSQHYVVGKGQYGDVIQVSFDVTDPLVAIPTVGEIWTVGRKRNEWYLDKRQDLKDENVPLAELEPGDRRITASGRILISGSNLSITDPIVINGSKSNGEALQNLLTALEQIGLIDDQTTT